MSIWEIAARAAEDSSEVDFDEGYFICPHCGEPIYDTDWTEADMMEDDCIICPICQEILADSYGIRDITDSHC